MRRFENSESVADIRARRHAEAADLSGASVGKVVAVQIGRREYLIFIGAGENLLEDGIGDAVVDQNFLFPLARCRGWRKSNPEFASLRG